MLKWLISCHSRETYREFPVSDFDLGPALAIVEISTRNQCLGERSCLFACSHFSLTASQIHGLWTNFHLQITALGLKNIIRKDLQEKLNLPTRHSKRLTIVNQEQLQQRPGIRDFITILRMRYNSKLLQPLAIFHLMFLDCHGPQVTNMESKTVGKGGNTIQDDFRKSRKWSEKSVQCPKYLKCELWWGGAPEGS